MFLKQDYNKIIVISISCSFYLFGLFGKPTDKIQVQ